MLHLGGEFDMSGKKEFEARLSEVLSARPREMILDLSAVVAIDSTGLRLVLEAWTRSRQNGFDFAVLLPEENGRVRGVFEEAGLDQALPMTDG